MCRRLILYFWVWILSDVEVSAQIDSSWKNNIKESSNFWYDNFNQCILKVSYNKKSSLTDEVVAYCNKIVNHNTHFNSATHEEYCTVGNHGCNTDLHFQGNIYNINAFNNHNFFPSQKPLLEIIKKMSPSKSCKGKVCAFGHLMFFGDSVTLSLFEAFICEIYRETRFIKLEKIFYLKIGELLNIIYTVFDARYFLFSKKKENFQQNNLLLNKFKFGFHFISKNITTVLQTFIEIM
jgi:hypothetical protein